MFETVFNMPLSFSDFALASLFRPGQRTAEDLEIIYDELLHIKALSHLSNTVSLLLCIYIFYHVKDKGYSTEMLFMIC